VFYLFFFLYSLSPDVGIVHATPGQNENQSEQQEGQDDQKRNIGTNPLAPVGRDGDR